MIGLGDSSYFATFLQAIFAFFFLLLLTRILGKKQMSQLTYFNYVAGVSIGTLSANAAVESWPKAGYALLALAVWVVLTILLGLISLRSSKARVLFNGEPSILIRKGFVQRKVLGDLRMNMDDLVMMLRKANAFSIADVDYAILEPNGQLSVMLKYGKQPATKTDLDQQAALVRNLPTLLVVDGTVMQHELQELGLGEDWLFSELKQQGITSAADVLFAEYGQDGTLSVQKKTE